MENNEEKIEVKLSITSVVLGVALMIGIVGISLIYVALTN